MTPSAPFLRQTSKRPVVIGIVLAAMVGLGCGALVLLGNPGNMGICGACFLRDTAGSLNLFPAGPRIFRPEVVGIAIGALAWMVATRRFQARSGSHSVTRFFFGVLMAWATLVFLGCPFRMLQRVGGGDLNAWVGALGLIGGVGIGLFFEKRGYSVGKTQPVAAPIGLLGPFSLILLAVLFWRGGIPIGPGPGDGGTPPHAFWLTALGIATAGGAVLSATGFCAISSARQVFSKPKGMLIAAVALIAAYGAVVFVGGKGHFGFENQPAAHGETLWNILSLAVVGLTGCIVGGCPVRQIVMTGEGNGDAFVTVAGLIVGGATAHTLGIASSGAGTTPNGRTIVIAGLILAIIYAAWITHTTGKATRASGD